MTDLLKLNQLKNRPLTGLLGLSFDGSKLDGVVLRRIDGALQVQQEFSATLTLDPLTADPDLVGREIRNSLDAAEVRERRCVVGLPLKWVLTTHAEIPELPQGDLESFLQIEAERGFPCDVSTLHFCASLCRSPSGTEQALLVAAPRNHLKLLEEALLAAKLKPMTFSLGITALQPPAEGESKGILAVVIGESHVGLQITCGGGIAALRALEGALQEEGGRRRLQPDLIAREARITLGQLPADLRQSVQLIRIFGPRDLAQELADEMELRLESMGLKVEVVTRYSSDEFGLQVPADSTVSPALSLAARQIAGRKMVLDLLPPKVTSWQQFSTRYSSGRLRLAGAVAASMVLLIAGLFLFQQWQLSRLGSQWKGMASKVRELEAIEQQIHQFRPWFDDSLRGLTILRQLTAAFPEDGVVSAKTIEIRDLTAVTCTGVARDNQALLKTMEKVNATPGVGDFHGGPLRGKSPIQFTFNFSWSEGGKSAN